jgi:hypothetical protein
MRRIVLGVALIATLVVPEAAFAQGGPGFLFNRPRVSIGFRSGYVLPRIASPFFDEARARFNLNRFDFDAPYLGGEVAARVSERWDVALGVGWAQAKSDSHYRDWVEEVGSERLEIEQQNRFETVSANVGARYYFSDRGRTIGRFAWVPTRIAPYVGGGVGVTWYELEQAGDFVVEETGEIFSDELSTDGTGATVFAAVGADLSLGKQFYLTAEGRYSLANAEMSGQYAGYDGIDLSGLQLITGISLRW